MVVTSVLWIAVVVAVFSGPGSPLSIALPDGTAYDVRPVDVTPRVESDPARAELWREAVAAYRGGRYADSASLFARLDGDPDRTGLHDARLYRGVSLLLDGRAGEARDVLETAKGLAEEIGRLATTEEFYLGLAALAENDVEMAVRCFDRARGGSFESDSRFLLSALD